MASEPYSDIDHYDVASDLRAELAEDGISIREAVTILASPGTALCPVAPKGPAALTSSETAAGAPVPHTSS